MNRHTIAVAAVLVLTVTGVTFAPAPAAAQSSDDGFLDGVYEVVEDEDGDGIKADDAVARWVEASTAGLERVSWSISKATGIGGSDTEPTAARHSAEVQSSFNSYNVSIQQWVNNRTTATEEHDVMELRLSIDGTTATRYVVANVSGGNYTQLRMVNKTNRTVDDTTVVCGFAAERAPEEQTRFIEDYVQTGEDPSQSYLAKMSGKYGPDVESTLLPTRGECDA